MLRLVSAHTHTHTHTHTSHFVFWYLCSAVLPYIFIPCTSINPHIKKPEVHSNSSSCMRSWRPIQHACAKLLELMNWRMKSCSRWLEIWNKCPPFATQSFSPKIIGEAQIWLSTNRGDGGVGLGGGGRGISKIKTIEPQREKTYFLIRAPNKTQISLRKRCTLGYPKCPPPPTPSEDSDQPAQWIFAGRTCPKVRFLMPTSRSSAVT